MQLSIIFKIIKLFTKYMLHAHLFIITPFISNYSLKLYKVSLCGLKIYSIRNYEKLIIAKKQYKLFVLLF